MPSSSSESDPAGEEKLSVRELFEAEETPLLRYAYSLTGRRAIAEEIVQDVFLQLHSHWESVDNPKAWLFRSVRNRAYSHHRDNKREILSDGKNGELEPAPDSGAGRGSNPGDLLERMEAAGYLRLLMAEMPEADRQLIHLKYFEDLKYREISKRTGLGIGNVGYRLHHLLRQLAEKLRQLGIDGTATP